MKALSVALKDLQLTLKDPGTWAYLFLFPLIFVFVFGGGFAVLSGEEAGDEEAMSRIVLPVVNLDEGSFRTNLVRVSTSLALTPWTSFSAWSGRTPSWTPGRCCREPGPTTW